MDLKFLLSNIANYSGISPKIFPKIEKLIAGNQIIDLLFHKPSNVNSRNLLENHLLGKSGDLIITKIEVEYREKSENRKSPLKIRCFNKFGYLNLLFFKTYPSYIERHFQVGSKIAVSGIIDFSNSSPQIIHPDYVFEENLINQIPQKEAIYPLTYGLTSKMLSKLIRSILRNLPELSEWIDLNLVKKNNWPSFKKALTNIHYPSKIEDLDSDNMNIKRLAYDELLAASLTNIIAKENNLNNQGIKNEAPNILVEEVIKTLPFELTEGQNKSLKEIFDDMKSGKKMLRLLQGDVGSGKTIIAFLAAILNKEDNKQSAIIVPISLLANQHFEVFSKLTENLDINLALLTSRTTKSNKNKILKDLKDGKIDIIIGTHALIYDDIIFKNLGLIVIDEQHRFGVMQRLNLVKKGLAPDVLLMSATPIPRSLMMTIYGDMDISLLRQKPKNRIKIETLIKPIDKLNEIHESIRRAINNGEKIYWICPLIEESDELEFSNVLEKFELFTKLFGKNKVALIHGKLKGKEKDEIMLKFSDKNSEARVLIATTVIEVGIDIKDATIMVIENSEKFGLSQLHQLRGRVGRSDKKSYCLLLYSKNTSFTAKKRLEIMRDCFDGFEVAEEDLKMRGAGQIFGTRQSGLPEYKFANLAIHSNLLKIANKNAQVILANNPNLEGDVGKNIKNLLSIFKYDNFIKLVKSG